MATYSSKQEKGQVLDPIIVLVVAMLIVTLMILGHLQVNVHSSVRSAEHELSTNLKVSFSADQQYWDAHCSHGWSNDSGCENIVQRAQACYIGVAGVPSAYCAQYVAYLKGLQYKRLATTS